MLLIIFSDSIPLGLILHIALASFMHRSRELMIVNQTLLVDVLIQMLQVHSYTLQVHSLGFTSYMTSAWIKDL